ncbi:BMP family ABC transporter substrate-binding protein [Schaedlerella arabinosiphila]|uniref:BMP family ABC transporter substrate-binding protein n=1 Tax=Schaedlerella arabinosiphila TaxID=2044587 RepID=A0A426DMY3_9FIRM|nr:BMP family ABC transporter substrate-binding protein [Schaedlerella arabinosiphila]MCI9633211.1 BMP family ABC transporter substrate-binding protein [Ruminococcus sp.]RRK34147.1 BMP family ABC transporter substrate-binding protein [Schaedlerella arabinosiphila]
MKKRIALWVMCLAMGTVFYGCSAPEPEESTDTGAASEETAETERYEGNAEDYKAALLIPGSLGDKSFFDASYQAVGLLEEEYGMDVDYVECGTDASKYYPAYVDLCQGGYDLILTVSSNGDDALIQIAEEYPDQKFISLDGELDDIPSNVYIIAPKNNEMSYLAGAVAALKAQELGDKTIGFVGGMDIPGINEFLVGYIEGAQQIMPDIQVQSSYVGSFTDTAKGKENGLLLYNSGISVVFTAAGQSGIGVLDAAVQTGNYVIGVDSDQAEALKDSQPEMANVVITSAIKNIPENALHIVQKAMDGEVNYGKKEYYGLKEGAVGLAENEFYQKLMSEEDRQTISDLKEKVMNGEVELTETMGLSTEELSEIRDKVRP